MHCGKSSEENHHLLVGATILLGFCFLCCQGYEYFHAYNELNLTLASGVYGSTFFLLTRFHGSHVFLGGTMLTVVLVRVIRGHFTPDHHFAFEGAAWYWHFVDRGVARLVRGRVLAVDGSQVWALTQAGGRFQQRDRLKDAPIQRKNAASMYAGRRLLLMTQRGAGFAERPEVECRTAGIQASDSRCLRADCRTPRGFSGARISARS